MPDAEAHLRVLIVEDSEEDAALVLRELRKAGYETTSERVDSAEAMRAALKAKPWDIILSDYVIPGFGGIEALQIAKEHDPGLPFIVVSGKVGDETLVEAMRAGAMDFVMKDRRSRLGPAVKRELADAAARRAFTQAQIEWRSAFDAVQDAIFVHDAQYRIIRANLAYAELGGLPVERVVGRPYWEIFPKLDGPLPGCRRAIAEGGIAEDQIDCADGRTFASRSFSSGAASGNSAFSVHVMQDVTERNRAERELRRLNWALRALGLGNSALAHAQSERELFKACCDAVAGAEGYPLAWIGLACDDAAHSVEVVASAGKAATRYLDGFEVSWADVPIGRGTAGTAIRTGVTQMSNNLAQSGAYLPWIARARASNLASCVALPLFANGAVIGVLVVYSHQLDAFGAAEIRLMEELAVDIGYGVAARRTQLAYETSLAERELAARRLHDAFEGLIGVLAATVERRDPYTAGHQRRVAKLASAIGRTLWLDPERVEGLHFAATIHDIGKVYVPAEILARPGKLKPSEWEFVKTHAQVGFEIIKEVELPWPVADMIRQHHERLDGSGYPQGLKGDQILLESRILAVADVVEAMSSHRPYRAGFGIDAALAQIRQDAGIKLDAKVVDACERVFGEQGFSFEKA